jgi:5-formyltetrahydrofolate cyclo-ligase
VDERKRTLRAEIRARRRDRSIDDRRENAERLASHILALPEIAHAHRIAAYLSMPEEPGTGPARTALRARGVRILLPVPRVDRSLDWVGDDGRTPVTPGPTGPTPTGERLGPDALVEVDAVIAPALAVDSLGTRLGQGAGYYDRALAGLDPTTPIIALVHDDEFLDVGISPLPRQPHDQRVRIVITPSGTHHLDHPAE